LQLSFAAATAGWIALVTHPLLVRPRVSSMVMSTPSPSACGTEAAKRPCSSTGSSSAPSCTVARRPWIGVSNGGSNVRTVTGMPFRSSAGFETSPARSTLDSGICALIARPPFAGRPTVTVSIGK